MRTETFRVTRLSLAYLAVAQYLRTYWWFAAVIPTFGLILLLFGPGVMKAMGLMALLWPLSLPARAIFVTSKVGKLLQRGAWATVEGTTLYLHGEEGGGMKLNLASRSPSRTAPGLSGAGAGTRRFRRPTAFRDIRSVRRRRRGRADRFDLKGHP